MASVSKKELNRFLRDIDGASLTALSDVTAGYGYYRRYLKSSVTGRFEWQGLPATMDAHILEDMLISEGAVIPIEKGSNLWVQPLYAYGVGVYPDEPPKYLYANPVLGSMSDINVDWYKPDACVGFENPNHYVMQEVIDRSALLLARIESTIELVLINNNGTELMIASNQNVADAITKIFEARAEGRVYVPSTPDVSKTVGESYKIIEGTRTKNEPDILQLLTTYNNVLRQFYRKFGINISKDKSQAILSDETESDNALLWYTLDSALSERRKFADALNRKYGLNVAVDVNRYLVPDVTTEPAEPEEPAEPKEPTEPEEPTE